MISGKRVNQSYYDIVEKNEAWGGGFAGGVHWSCDQIDNSIKTE